MNIFSLIDQNIGAEFTACWNVAENATSLTEKIYFKVESSAWITKWLSTCPASDVAMLALVWGGSVWVHVEDHKDTSTAVDSKTHKDWIEQK